VTSEAQQSEGRADPRAAFYRAQHPRLVGFIRRRIGDEHEAEAMAQETWMAFLRRFSHYQVRYDDPVAVLYVIARRMIADWYRAQNRTPALLADEGVAERLARLAQDQPDGTAMADLRIDLAHAVTRLTPRQREALQLYYVDGLGRPAVAELMGVTIDGVKKLIGSALKTLREAQDLKDYRGSITIHTAATSRRRKEVRK
jgi:RNA polymerase sigma-70 factor (ECF subfamily)